MWYYYTGVLVVTLIGYVEKIDLSSLNLIAVAFGIGIIFQQFRDVKREVSSLKDSVTSLDRKFSNHISRTECKECIHECTHNKHVQHDKGISK